MYSLEPLRRGKPISFADVDVFTDFADAIRVAQCRNLLRDAYPEDDDGLRFDVYMDKPAGDSALVWSHKAGHTYIG